MNDRVPRKSTVDQRVNNSTATNSTAISSTASDSTATNSTAINSNATSSTAFDSTATNSTANNVNTFNFNATNVSNNIAQSNCTPPDTPFCMSQSPVRQPQTSSIDDLDQALITMRSERTAQNSMMERQQKFFEQIFEQQNNQMKRFEKMFEFLINNAQQQQQQIASMQQQYMAIVQQPAPVLQQQHQQAHVQQQQEAPVLQQPAPVLQQQQAPALQQPAPVLQQQQAPVLQQPNILLINSKQNIRIEEFTGNSDIFDFLKDIEYYAETDKLSSAEKVKLVFSSVSRQIRLWLSSLREDDRSNYVSLKHKLISQYGLKDDDYWFMFNKRAPKLNENFKDFVVLLRS
jgi:hypothetical protein